MSPSSLARSHLPTPPLETAASSRRAWKAPSVYGVNIALFLIFSRFETLARSELSQVRGSCLISQRRGEPCLRRVAGPHLRLASQEFAPH